MSLQYQQSDTYEYNCIQSNNVIYKYLIMKFFLHILRTYDILQVKAL